MPEETLLTAARRLVRFMRIDETHGGLVTEDTIKARETLDKMVSKYEKIEGIDQLMEELKNGIRYETTRDRSTRQ